MRSVFSLLVILTVVLALTSLEAKAADASGPQSGFTWSWAAIKEKVKQKMAAFWALPVVQQVVAKIENPSGPFIKVAETKPEPKTLAPQLADTRAENEKLTPEKKEKYAQAAHQIKEIKVARVATPWIPSKDKNLVMGRNDIPVFEFKKFHSKLAVTKVARVPLLDVGREPVLDSSSFSKIDFEPYPVVKYVPLKELDAPELMSASKFKDFAGPEVALVAPIEKIEIPALETEKKVTAQKIAQLIYKIVPDVPYTPLAVTVIGAEDLKMLRGLILFEKKDQCHVASGIFSDLLESQNPMVTLSSHFHLGTCLHEMNLPKEASLHLNKVIRLHDPVYTPQAITVSVQDIQGQHEEAFVDAVLTVNDPKLIPKEIVPEIDYLKAKYFIKKGHTQKALDYAEKVPTTHPRYYKAQYIGIVADYMAGRLDASIDRSKRIANELIKKGSNKDILALVEVNLGRIAFQKGKYKDSLEAFQRVPKEHPLWMQALTEQAWTQLQSKDASGAIGNMHSIQSPFFDGVFKPESYVVRSIGYLNICQYADAFKSLAYLEHRYLPWLGKIETYNKAHSSTQTYQTVIKYLQGKPNLDVDGLPFQAIREAARQRDYLNVQESVNQLIDENGGYAFIRGLLEKDRRALTARRNATVTKIVQLQQKIKKARVTPGAMKDFNAWRFELANYEDFLSVYEFKMATMKEGEDGLKRMVPKAQARIAEAKEILKDQGGKILKSHLGKLAKVLKTHLENNELLKYEIYAGSGENLRYQVAGGRTGAPSKNAVDRKPAGVNWDFQGEFWEDEIGHYRSSLKNNCQSTQVQAKKE